MEKMKYGPPIYSCPYNPYNVGMKTTVEIADPLFKMAKTTAKARGITLRELIEDGIRMAVEEPKKPYKFEPVIFKGGGQLITDWEKIREIIYEGHGG